MNHGMWAEQIGRRLSQALRRAAHQPFVQTGRNGVRFAARCAAASLIKRPYPLARADALARYEALFTGVERKFETIIREHVGEFRWAIPTIYNGFFESVDAELLYAMVRWHRPRLVVEVGSGYSTGFILDAMKRNNCGRLVCVDPAPRRRLPDSVQHFKCGIEEINRTVFDELGPNDILFLDSSHTTQEAQLHAETLLPALHAGVLVHHHDVLFPYEKYHHDDACRYGEPDVILDFYDRNRALYQVFCSTAYVVYQNCDLVKALIPSFRWMPARVPGSLWARKLR
jgi:predicted O-methyltransferase YrrM